MRESCIADESMAVELMQRSHPSTHTSFNNETDSKIDQASILIINK